MAMQNSSIEEFMRKHFDEGYLQIVDEPVRKYVELINGVNLTASMKKRPAPKKKPAEEKQDSASKKAADSTVPKADNNASQSS